MADERYEWLDRDAAERLLRGEPVESADARVRTEAARLAATLEGMVDPGYRFDDGEMPGEATAMAAFRKARADTAPSAGASLGTVRLSRRARPARGVGLARPVRFGIAAAVAGCAIGGVAVAAGTGVLPTFGDERPAPVSSVSAAQTPGPVLPPTPGDSGSSAPSKQPGTTVTPPLPPLPPPRPGSPRPTPDDRGTEGPGAPVQEDRPTPGAGEPDRNAEWYRKSVDACRDYRTGQIAPERKRRLDTLAKGSERVKRFCDELLSGDSQGQGGDGGSGGGHGGKNSGGTGGDGDGTLGPGVPPVRWSLVPGPSVKPSGTGGLTLGATAAF